MLNNYTLHLGSPFCFCFTWDGFLLCSFSSLLISTLSVPLKQPQKENIRQLSPTRGISVDRENESRWPRRRHNVKMRKTLQKSFSSGLAESKGPTPGCSYDTEILPQCAFMCSFWLALLSQEQFWKWKEMFLKEATRCCTMK